MKGVLIISHGSRQKSVEKTLDALIEAVRERLPGTTIEAAYMEFGTPEIPAGLDALIKKGVNEIAVVPYFLFDGIHIKEDIPEMLGAYQAEHPQVSIVMGRPLGEDARLADILADRVRECL